MKQLVSNGESYIRLELTRDRKEKSPKREIFSLFGLN